MKTQITRISVLQSSKIMTAMYVLLGFIYTFIGFLMLIFGGPEMTTAAAIYMIMPIILGVFGFIFFVIFSALYNFLAKHIGGLEFELSAKEDGTAPAVRTNANEQ